MEEPDDEKDMLVEMLFSHLAKASVDKVTVKIEPIEDDTDMINTKVEQNEDASKDKEISNNIEDDKKQSNSKDFAFDDLFSGRKSSDEQVSLHIRIGI